MIDIQALLTEIPSHVNMILILGLMALGYVIKHAGFAEKYSNKLIPITLIVVAIIVTMITSDCSTANGVVLAAVNGLVNAAISVWIHETGKNIFEMKNNTDL